MKQLLDDIQRWINQNDERLLIGISGHGAAGNSTFANDLKMRMKLENVNVLGTDPYIIDSEIRNKTIITYNYDTQQHHNKMTVCHPAVHHLPSLERDIQMICDGVGFY